jgi:hypothetical protein
VVGSGANLVEQVVDAPLAVGLSAAVKAARYKDLQTNGVTYFPGQLSSNRNEPSALDMVAVGSEFPVNEDRTPAVELAEARLRAMNQAPSLTSGMSIGN